MDENKKLEFRGSSFMALVPFAIFIVITIALSFFNAADTNMMIGAGVIGLLVGMFFAKNLNDYWDVILEGCRNLWKYFEPWTDCRRFGLVKCKNSC